VNKNTKFILTKELKRLITVKQDELKRLKKKLKEVQK